ncbi:MAG: endonuclease MutS2 [Lachnospiraceae bacterium]|nr:endonuclease MutS2 [Lachnospiraceae bacterium]
MNKKALQSLEYDKIIEQLVTYADSPLGKEQCRNLRPMNLLEEIVTAQNETAAALSRIYARGKLSFAGLRDIRPSMLRLDVGGSLNMGELLAIARSLEIAEHAVSYGAETENKEHEPGEEVEETGDALTPYFAQIESLPGLSREIHRCIISEDEMADEASAELSRIRRQIRSTGDKIHAALNGILNSSRDLLQDAVIVQRNNRYCLPVKLEYKNQIQGITHDQSSTGSTVFIEPMAVVKINNDLAELVIREQEEIQKVLARLSEETAPYAGALTHNVELLLKLDFIFAKGAFARHQKATMPVFNAKGYLNLKKARHPLIDPKKVVPIDVALGKDYTLLVITGPNTGGKTVSLKTVGLLTLMGQAGLHIPAFDGSELSVFQEVFADIGDEQSIEQSLSTFSSHMVNTVEILKKANRRSLVLFDELGAGTDPTEGAALAISILSYLKERDVRTMATTHYSELKVYALSTDGVENASCEFNVETLSPTYRLLIGIPGKSNAFAISRKLGLPEEIIAEADTHIANDSKSFEDLIADLEDSRMQMEKEQAQIEALRAETEKLKERLAAKNEKLDQNRERIIKEANEEAVRILQEAKDYADQTIRNYNKWSKGSGSREMEQERNALNEKLKGAQGKAAEQKKAEKKTGNRPEDFKRGDAVRVLSLNLNGIITKEPNAKGECDVQMGIMHSMIHITDLEKIDEQTVTGDGVTRTGAGKVGMSKAMTVSTSLNLIGKTVDEALPELDKYLDDAYLGHVPAVTIIHGRGTGALQKAVHNHLKKTKYVKNYRLGEFGEGGNGVTVVTFKQ